MYKDSLNFRYKNSIQHKPLPIAVATMQIEKVFSYHETRASYSFKTIFLQKNMKTFLDLAKKMLSLQRLHYLSFIAGQDEFLECNNKDCLRRDCVCRMRHYDDAEERAGQ